MRRFHRYLAGAILVAALHPLPAHAQDPDSAPVRRWAAVVVWGGPREIGTARDVEAAMVRDGFDDDTQCWLFCEGVIPHPTSHSGAAAVGPSRLFEVSYRPWDRIGLAVTLAQTHLGWTSGYRVGADILDSDYLFLNYAVTTLAAAALLDVGPLELQLGPALQRADTWLNEAARRVQVRHAYRIGFLAGAGTSLRLYRALHLEARAQYRHVGSVEVGPYAGDVWDLAEFDADFSHAFVGFGIGVRF